jgi:hypothetical protein
LSGEDKAINSTRNLKDLSIPDATFLHFLLAYGKDFQRPGANALSKKERIEKMKSEVIPGLEKILGADNRAV